MLVLPDPEVDSASDDYEDSPQPQPQRAVLEDQVAEYGSGDELLLQRARASSMSRSQSLSKRLTFRQFKGATYSKLSTTTNAAQGDKAETTSRKKEEEEMTFWKWVMRCKWIRRLPFMYFVVGVIAVPVLATFHFMDADTTYLIVSAFILLNIFGAKHFYTLLNLKKEVDTFNILNQKFETETIELRSAVDSLQQANENLRDSERRIKFANAENRKNLKQFTDVQDTMQTLNVANVEELQKVANSAGKIGAQWQKQVVERERDMLHTVFDRFETRSNKAGMSRQDFAAFSQELPKSYQVRFARLGTFENLSTDGVHISFSDFDAALDVFAEMEAYDCDIDFSIDKEAKEESLPMAMSLDRKTVTFHAATLEDVPADWSTMKRWTTRRKDYNDNITRTVVVHKRTFVDPKQAKMFTAALGLFDHGSDELPAINELDASSSDSGSGDYGRLVGGHALADSGSSDYGKMVGGHALERSSVIERHARKTSLIQAGQQIVDQRNAIKLDLLLDE